MKKQVSDINNNKVYKIWQIYFAAFLGGALGACYLLKKNSQQFGNNRLGNRFFLIGLIFILVVSLIVAFTNIDFYSFLIVLSIVLPISLTRLYQKTSIKDALDSGMEKQPFLKVLAISLCSLILTLLLLCSAYLISHPSELTDIYAYHKAKVSLKDKNYSAAFHYMMALAKKGRPAAQDVIGNFYFNGQGVAKNFKKAHMWYEKSAKQGFADAQYNLAILYINGFGVEQDNSKTFYWAQKSATQGFPAAELLLGKYYIAGIGVSTNVTEGIKWIQKSAKQGYQPAIGWLHKHSAQNLIGSNQ